MIRRTKADRYKSALEALTDLTREQMQSCLSCGTKSPLGGRFCPQCGGFLKATKPAEKSGASVPGIGTQTETAEEITDDGFRLTQEGNWDGAIRRYNEAIKLNPNYGLAFTNLGYALNRMGQYEDAIKALSIAIGLTSHAVHLYRIYDLRGFSKMNLKEYEGAIADFTTALSYNSDDAKIFLHRAQARAEVGDRSKALQDVNRVLRLDPDNYNAIRLKRTFQAGGVT